MQAFIFTMYALLRFLASCLILLYFSSCSESPRRIRQLSFDYTGYHVKTDRGNCLVEKDAIDDLTGTRKTDLEAVELFHFTHDPLRKYFENKPFITCLANLSEIDEEQVVLRLQFEIDIQQIDASYNGLSEGALLRIDLIDGQKVFLQNIASEKSVSEAKVLARYTGYYPLSRKDQKLLRKTEIDHIGVIWNGGYESYPIYEIDFFIAQLACLKQVQ